MKLDLVYIEHIQQSINKIIEYTTHCSYQSFVKNEMIQDAVIRNIEIIGEAAKNISEDFRKSYDNVPWRSMTGMRDKLIHDYMGIDIEVVWKTIEKDIPYLKSLLDEFND